MCEDSHLEMDYEDLNGSELPISFDDFSNEFDDDPDIYDDGFYDEDDLLNWPGFH